MNKGFALVVVNQLRKKGNAINVSIKSKIISSILIGEDVEIINVFNVGKTIFLVDCAKCVRLVGIRFVN